jgi:hypothetical protein
MRAPDVTKRSPMFYMTIYNFTKDACQESRRSGSWPDVDAAYLRVVSGIPI